MKLQSLVTAIKVAALAGAMTGLAQAAGEPPIGRSLAASCTACHGTNGNAQGGALVLAGLGKEFFVQQMQAFKSGKRSATVMHQLAKGYSDAEIEVLATYFSTQKRSGGRP